MKMFDNISVVAILLAAVIYESKRLEIFNQTFQIP